MKPIKVVLDNEFMPAAQGILGLARNNVAILTYKFELSVRPDARALNSLVQTLYDIASKKVLVRVLLNTTGRRSGLTRINRSAASVLRKHGLQVRYLPDGRCQHAKVILVDGCYALIGSHNWSPRSMDKNLEASVLISGPQYLENVQKMFDRIWGISTEL